MDLRSRDGFSYLAPRFSFAPARARAAVTTGTLATSPLLTRQPVFPVTTQQDLPGFKGPSRRLAVNFGFGAQKVGEYHFTAPYRPGISYTARLRFVFGVL